MEEIVGQCANKNTKCIHHTYDMLIWIEGKHMKDRIMNETIRENTKAITRS